MFGSSKKVSLRGSSKAYERDQLLDTLKKEREESRELKQRQQSAIILQRRIRKKLTLQQIKNQIRSEFDQELQESKLLFPLLRKFLYFYESKKDKTRLVSIVKLVLIQQGKYNFFSAITTTENRDYTSSASTPSMYHLLKFISICSYALLEFYQTHIQHSDSEKNQILLADKNMLFISKLLALLITESIFANQEEFLKFTSQLLVKTTLLEALLHFMNLENTITESIFVPLFTTIITNPLLSLQQAQKLVELLFVKYASLWQHLLQTNKSIKSVICNNEDFIHSVLIGSGHLSNQSLASYMIIWKEFSSKLSKFFSKYPNLLENYLHQMTIIIQTVSNENQMTDEEEPISNQLSFLYQRVHSRELYLSLLQNQSIIILYATFYNQLLDLKATDETQKLQLLNILTIGFQNLFSHQTKSLLHLFFDYLFVAQQEAYSIPVLDCFAVFYSHMLSILDDEEFYDKEYPFTKENNCTIISMYKQLVFELYWSNSSNQSNNNGEDEKMKAHFAELLKKLHARDSRRQFSFGSSVEEFWMIPQTLDLNYSSIQGGDLQSDTTTSSASQDEQRFILGETDEELNEHNVRQIWRQRHYLSLSRSLRQQPIAKPNVSKWNMTAKHNTLLLILREIPFVIPFTKRVELFEQFLKQDAQLLHQEFMNPVLLKRSTIFEDAFAHFYSFKGYQIKQQWNVQFVSEHGFQEEGIGHGVVKDFIIELCKQAFSPQYGLFVNTTSTDEYTIYPNPASRIIHGEQHLNYFYFLGMILGKAMYEQLLVDVPFARFFLSKLLGKHNDLNHVQYYDKELYKNLIFLKQYQGNVEDLNLNFTIAEDYFGEKKVINLIPNGDQVAVTNENKYTYIQRIVHYRLNVQIREQCQSFLQGMEQVIPKSWLQMFNETELFLLICGGEQVIDLEDLKKHTVYGNGFYADHPTIVTFWQVVNELSTEQKKKLLKFVTSAPRAPLLGFSQLHPSVSIKMTSDRDISRLPSASTCINLLKMPPYKNREQLKKKLIQAIENSQGFDLT